MAFALNAAPMTRLFLNIICQCHYLCVGNSFILHQFLVSSPFSMFQSTICGNCWASASVAAFLCLSLFRVCTSRMAMDVVDVVDVVNVVDVVDVVDGQWQWKQR